MIRGRLLLWADSVLEAQVVTSFLQAADYEVVNFGALPASNENSRLSHFDLAVVILDRWDSSLDEISSEIRAAIGDSQLPIVAVSMRNPPEPDEHRFVLLRPIRLFELVHAIEHVIALSAHPVGQR